MKIDIEALRAKLATINAINPDRTDNAVAQPEVATTDSGEFTWSPEQINAITFAKELKSFCLIGAAGTGKSTTVREVLHSIMEATSYRTSFNTKSKHIPPKAPAIAVVAFTNRAINNTRKMVAAQYPALSAHCITIHKLLQFVPEAFDVWDEKEQKYKTKRHYVPTFTALNPLLDIKIIIIEEASMVDTKLFAQLQAGCPNATFIFLGDLNQIKPIYGDSILGFKLSEIPVIELARVYRQAMDSPIVAFQHKYTLAGNAPAQVDLAAYTGNMQFIPLKTEATKTNFDVMCAGVADKLRRDYESGDYNPDTDILLCPFNKSFGNNGINKYIAQWLGEKRNAVVYEILGGITKAYYAVGDYLLYNRQEYTITAIRNNSAYRGKAPKEPSTELQRTGYYKTGYIPKHATSVPDTLTHEDFMLMLSGNVSDDERNQISHILELTAVDNPDIIETISTKGQLSAVEFRYALSIHKAQGSEWEKVYLLMANAHSVMNCRELLYTGMTRARTKLTVFYSPQSAIGKRDSSIAKAILRQSIPGNTWQEKAKFFQSKGIPIAEE